jgi:hypothetical protein
MTHRSCVASPSYVCARHMALRGLNQLASHLIQHRQDFRTTILAHRLFFVPAVPPDNYDVRCKGIRCRHQNQKQTAPHSMKPRYIIFVLCRTKQSRSSKISGSKVMTCARFRVSATIILPADTPTSHCCGRSEQSRSSNENGCFQIAMEGFNPLKPEARLIMF